MNTVIGFVTAIVLLIMVFELAQVLMPKGDISKYVGFITNIIIMTLALLSLISFIKSVDIGEFLDEDQPANDTEIKLDENITYKDIIFDVYNYEDSNKN